MPGKPRPRAVVDASILVKWLVDEEYTSHALRARDDLLEGRVELHAPDLALLEAASALRKYVLRGIMEPRDARRGLELLAASGVTYHPVDQQLAAEALSLSLEAGITVYDAAYLVLAERLAAPFYTADEKLLTNSHVEEKKLATHIKDYPGTNPGPRG